MKPSQLADAKTARRERRNKARSLGQKSNDLLTSKPWWLRRREAKRAKKSVEGVQTPKPLKSRQSASANLIAESKTAGEKKDKHQSKMKSREGTKRPSLRSLRRKERREQRRIIAKVSSLVSETAAKRSAEKDELLQLTIDLVRRIALLLPFDKKAVEKRGLEYFIKSGEVLAPQQEYKPVVLSDEAKQALKADRLRHVTEVRQKAQTLDRSSWITFFATCKRKVSVVSCICCGIEKSILPRACDLAPHGGSAHILRSEEKVEVMDDKVLGKVAGDLEAAKSQAAGEAAGLVGMSEVLKRAIHRVQSLSELEKRGSVPDMSFGSQIAVRPASPSASNENRTTTIVLPPAAPPLLNRAVVPVTAKPISGAVKQPRRHTCDDSCLLPCRDHDREACANCASESYCKYAAKQRQGLRLGDRPRG